MALMEWRLVAETKEFVGPITVVADGVPVPTFEVQVTKGTARPGSSLWAAPHVTGDGEAGVMVGVDTAYPLVVNGVYYVWVRYTGAPERPVEKVGVIKVS